MTQAQTTRPEVGDEAPDFTLQDSNLKPVSLHDFRGKKVILAFFPAAFSGVCTTEMCTLRDSLAQLNAANAQVLGISADLPYSLAQFKQAQNLSFPLLSDYDCRAIDRYGVELTGFKGFSNPVAQRAVFVIDEQGKITWEWIADEPGQQPDYGRVIQAVS